MANEKRLIDANAMREDWLENGENEYVYDTNAVLASIDAQPTVDAAEVVRCKDCKWYKEGKLLAPNKFCFRLKHPTENRSVGYNFCEDDFCSYGERKDNVSITD